MQILTPLKLHLWHTIGMIRKAQDNLASWFREPSRKPIVIRGARQVGKSTLVRNFAKQVGIPIVEINLERHPHLDEVFASLNMEQIIDALENLPRVARISSSSLLFLDEIQATPHALAALRYFYEDRPELPVIAAGSLLEFALNDHDFSMPVGRVNYLHLGPMSFSEFLVGCGEDQHSLTLENFSIENPLSKAAHKHLSELFQSYSLVGGMPEAVADFSQNRQLSRCREIHQSILDTYRDDFSKYGLKQDLPRLHHVLNHALLYLGKKIKYTDILSGEQSRTVRRLLDLLIQARLFVKIPHSHGNGIPLSAEASPTVFKLQFVDIGLFQTVRGSPLVPLGANQNHLHLGAVTEQLVGQEMLANAPLFFRPHLYYWLREGRTGNAELDFLVGIGDQVIPVEVKSGTDGRMRSLNLFCQAKESKIAFRFDQNLASSHSLSNGTRLLSLPYFAAGQLERLAKTQVK